MSQEWNIRSRGHVCSICQKPLVDRAPVVSALRENAGGYERFDCHPECWKTAGRDWEPFSQWDGVYFAPVKEEKKEALKKEDAGELLRKLMTLDDPAMKNVVYVLAVMLERSKILVERDSKEQPDGSIRRVYEDRRQGDTFVILDPRLRLENIGEVQQQVVALLSGTKTLGEVAGEGDAPPDAEGDEAADAETA
ncbi:MAG: hypothetical protein K6F50_08535 [Kiritimatiellae bacterium]|nr:hypothetical protein [Kiritimatiellia bacterium]